MALPSFLDLVNDVLVRLREPEVSAINENVLSKIIGKFVNDAKRQVEDSYNWNALTSTVTVVTVPNTFNYGMTGTGARFKIIDAFNSTSLLPLLPVSTQWLNQQYIGVTSLPTGAPSNYNFNGTTPAGDTQVDVYPVPDIAYTLFFNMYIPQEALVADSDQMLIPSDPVIHLATAKALVERGEDQGTQSSEMYALYKQVLADYIAIESSRYIEEDSWDAV